GPLPSLPRRVPRPRHAASRHGCIHDRGGHRSQDPPPRRSRVHLSDDEDPHAEDLAGGAVRSPVALPLLSVPLPLPVPSLLPLLVGSVVLAHGSCRRATRSCYFYVLG